MNQTETYASRAISQPAASTTERHHNLAEPADACLS